MPRNGSGVYSKPAGTTAVPNTTIASGPFNSVIDDIAQDLNTVRPKVAGGTGGTQGAFPAQASDSSDPTKTVTWDLSGLTTATNRTIHMPDSDVALSKWEIIGDYTLTAVAQLIITNLSVYRKLRFTGYVYNTAGTGGVGIQTSTDNGSTYNGGASDYQNENSFVTAGTESSTITLNAFFLLCITMDAGINAGFNFDAIMEAFNKSQFAHTVNRGSYTASSSFVMVHNVGIGPTGTARNALKFVFGSGSATGTITVEGVRG